MMFHMYWGMFEGPIKEQLEKQGCVFTDDKKADLYQKVVNGWKIMKVHGFITENEADLIAKRVAQSMASCVRKKEEET